MLVNMMSTGKCRCRCAFHWRSCLHTCLHLAA